MPINTNDRDYLAHLWANSVPTNESGRGEGSEPTQHRSASREVFFPDDIPSAQRYWSYSTVVATKNSLKGGPVYLLSNRYFSRTTDTQLRELWQAIPLESREDTYHVPEVEPTCVSEHARNVLSRLGGSRPNGQDEPLSYYESRFAKARRYLKSFGLKTGDLPVESDATKALKLGPKRYRAKLLKLHNAAIEERKAKAKAKAAETRKQRHNNKITLLAIASHQGTLGLPWSDGLLLETLGLPDILRVSQADLFGVLNQENWHSVDLSEKSQVNKAIKRLAKLVEKHCSDRTYLEHWIGKAENAIATLRTVCGKDCRYPLSLILPDETTIEEANKYRELWHRVSNPAWIGEIERGLKSRNPELLKETQSEISTVWNVAKLLNKQKCDLISRVSNHKYKLEREERERIQKLEQAEKIALWRKGKDIRLPYSCPVLLRIQTMDGKRQIQTSRGARFSLAVARAIWPALRSGDFASIPDSLSHYRLDRGRTTADTLVIGCHAIPMEEVCLLAESLGWE